jgi:hypothetical protein
MGAAWVAGSVRAHALLRRRLGAETTRRLAESPSVSAAVRELAASPYRREARGCRSPAEVEVAIGATLLWNLRVLAGWLPRPGVQTLRALAGWFEIINVVDHARRLAGEARADPGEPYRLGALATAWARLAATASLAELRDVLAKSAWGDPGATDPAAIAISMAISGAVRVGEQVPEASDWAAGAAALEVARERFVVERELTAPVRHRVARLLGPRALAPDLDGLAAGLPAAARWALADVSEPEHLAGAEARWWRRVERDGANLLAGPRFGRDAVVGCAVALAADARRVRAGVQLAALDSGQLEAFDAAF